VAQRVQILLEDDLDGGKADETVTFGLDGSTYEVDLSSSNAKKLREALAPYVGVGRKVTARGRRAGGGRSRKGVSSASDIRAWARENGYEVSDRGRVPAEVRAAYEAAN
jgi:hypothetical protein